MDVFIDGWYEIFIGFVWWYFWFGVLWLFKICGNVGEFDWFDVGYNYF